MSPARLGNLGERDLRSPFLFLVARIGVEPISPDYESDGVPFPYRALLGALPLSYLASVAAEVKSLLPATRIRTSISKFRALYPLSYCSTPLMAVRTFTASTGRIRTCVFPCGPGGNRTRMSPCLPSPSTCLAVFSLAHAVDRVRCCGAAFQPCFPHGTVGRMCLHHVYVCYANIVIALLG